MRIKNIGEIHPKMILWYAVDDFDDRTVSQIVVTNVYPNHFTAVMANDEDVKLYFDKDNYSSLYPTKKEAEMSLRTAS